MILIDGKVAQVGRVCVDGRYASRGYVMTDNGPQQFWPDMSGDRHGLVVELPAPGTLDYLYWQHVYERGKAYSNYEKLYAVTFDGLERQDGLYATPSKFYINSSIYNYNNELAQGTYIPKHWVYKCEMVGNVIFIDKEHLDYLPIYAPGDTLSISAHLRETGLVYYDYHNPELSGWKNNPMGLEQPIIDSGYTYETRPENGKKINTMSWMLPLLPGSSIRATYKGTRKGKHTRLTTHTLKSIPGGNTIDITQSHWGPRGYYAFNTRKLSELELDLNATGFQLFYNAVNGTLGKGDYNAEGIFPCFPEIIRTFNLTILELF